jgi:hypothetical protein
MVSPSDLNDLNDLATADAPVLGDWSFGYFMLHFLINLVVVGVIIWALYYPKSRRRDYFFTFTLIGVSIFLMIFLLGSVKIKVGFALGLFAIFGIIRYRTESVPIREMTYLFAIIAISVINALAAEITYLELIFTNAIFIVTIWLLESNRWLKHVSCKIIQYDKIQLIIPDKREELIADLKKRTGLDIKKVEVGNIDFLKDSTFLKVYYEPTSEEINTAETITKMPRVDE